MGLESAIDSAFGTLHQWLAPVTDRLPLGVQHAIQSPVANKVLAGLIVYALLSRANRAFSRAAANNWQGTYAWKGDKELVLITGGCSGIGRQVVTDLAKRGIRVVVVDIQPPSEPLPKGGHFYQADITSSDSIREAASSIRRDHGEPTVLVNNAGVGYDGTILDEPEELIRRTFNVNVISHFLTVKEFLPDMIKNNHGHIITVASMASFVAVGEMADYSCSKAAALAFHESLTQELRYWYKAHKVRTSIIHPLWVRTPMTQQLSEAGKKFKQPIMTPEVVSKAIVKQIVSQTGGQVIIPPKLSFYSIIRALPTWMQEAARGKGSRDLKEVRDWQTEMEKKM